MDANTKRRLAQLVAALDSNVAARHLAETRGWEEEEIDDELDAEWADIQMATGLSPEAMFAVGRGVYTLAFS